MTMPKSSLSAGVVFCSALAESRDVTDLVGSVIPAIGENQDQPLPYISFRRIKLEATPQKSGQPGADIIQEELLCCTDNYEEGIKIAEAVRTALDFQSYESDGLKMRACWLADSEEIRKNGIYIQRMIFNAKF